MFIFFIYWSRSFRGMFLGYMFIAEFVFGIRGLVVLIGWVRIIFSVKSWGGVIVLFNYINWEKRRSIF